MPAWTRKDLWVAAAPYGFLYERFHQGYHPHTFLQHVHIRFILPRPTCLAGAPHLRGLLEDIGESIEVGVGAGDAMPQ